MKKIEKTKDVPFEGKVVATFSIKITFESFQDSKSSLIFQLKQPGEFQDFALNAPINKVN
jgi:hypothetical protein